MLETTTPTEAARILIERGHLTEARLLLEDDEFLRRLGDSVADLELQYEERQRDVRNERRAKLDELRRRAERSGLLAEFEESVADADARLDTLEAELSKREETRNQSLLARIDAASSDIMDNDAVSAWREAVRAAVRRGAFEAAEAAIAAGPDQDVPPEVDIPPAPAWRFTSEDSAVLLDWLVGDGNVPAGFSRYRPDVKDEAAWALILSLRDGSEDVLERIAGVLGTRTSTRVDPTTRVAVCFLEDLSAPGFHALARRRWPDGIPIYLHGTPILEHELAIRVVDRVASTVPSSVLELSINDLLSVLHDPRRRQRILVRLGRQLLLHHAFHDLGADTSVRWAREDLPLANGLVAEPTLLVGAPGAGKSTALMWLCEQHGGSMVDVRDFDDLPEEGPVFVDDLDALERRDQRRLVKDVHWEVSRGREGAIVIGARPETANLLQRTSGGSLFARRYLKLRSPESLRRQATVMLGWVGVEARDLASYDRLALLAGGNPTLLFLLCQGLTQHLVEERSRAFSPDVISATWNSPSFRVRARGLLWEPLARTEGVVATAAVVNDYAQPDMPLVMEDIIWAMGDRGMDMTPAAIIESVQLLVEYGFLFADGDPPTQVFIARNGLGLLFQDWHTSSSTTTD